ncbi:hypothetical protein MMC13_007882 [Lambiella insularis]|nr:hypothetical protein [Lambiella insularis]
MVGVQPPKSPTLLPPRKSVELEDPGAHDLESSNEEEDVFSDAHDGQHSPRYGQIALDDVPVKVLVTGLCVMLGVSDEQQGRKKAGVIPIPKTVVEKVDPLSPCHGDVPGTAAHAMRLADAEPDVISQAPLPPQIPPEISPGTGKPTAVPIPRTVITRVDSKPSHGEIPGTEAYNIRTEDAVPDVVEKKSDVPGWPTSSVNRSSHFDRLVPKYPNNGISPIAADGGFGPMDYDEDDNLGDEEQDYKQKTTSPEMADDYHNSSPGEDVEDLADEFDDFEEGAAVYNFGDFNETLQPPDVVEDIQQDPLKQTFHTHMTPFPVIDFSGLKSLDDIIEATRPHLSALFPGAYSADASASLTLPEHSSVFLTDRSLSLWSQLVAPPPLQPPNWTRSRIRRLFLVSLGVPVDLDEIHPASKQKKLILPFNSAESSREPRKGSVARLKHSETNASTTSIDSSPDTTTASASTTKSASKRRKGPPPAPEFDLVAVRQMCTTTEAALERLDDAELRAHVSRLEELTHRGKEALQYWVKRKEGAVGDKEVFEGVIENLVRHARKVRK